jgi:O-methyltransferase
MRSLSSARLDESTPAGHLLDLLPLAEDLPDLRTYRRGVGLWRVLYRGGWTMTSCRRGRTLHRLARIVEGEGVPGALVDCGVWNGGSTVLLSAGAPTRPAWAFDSFEGLPEPGDHDGPDSAGWQGECHGSEAKLREGFARFADPARLHIARGWFADTLPAVGEQVGAVAVLHADGDWYESVRLTLETFYPRLSVGGFAVIDDYWHWEGARGATDEYRREHGIEEPLVRVDYTGVYWRRRA